MLRRPREAVANGGRESRVSAWRRVWALWLAVGLASVLRAHDPGLSTAELKLRADALELTVSFAPGDVGALLPHTAQARNRWSPTEFEDTRAALTDLAPSLWQLAAAGAGLTPREVHVELTKGADSVNFRLTYPRPAAGILKLRAARLSALPPGHREYFSALDERGALLVEKLLSVRSDAVEVTLGAAGEKTPASQVVVSSSTVQPAPVATESVRASFWGFLKLGVEHIWTGYDHLLFLFGLLVVCRSFRSIVAIISCFTLAHSITLALATLDVVNLPSRYVEPLIAASIVFVGAENLLRRGEEPRGRWALTFGFGLIHGFGFASVLRELGVGQGGQGLAMPLFTFNLGVEVGQVAIAALVLPIVWQLRKKEAFVRRGVPVLSAVVTLAGLYWLLERTIFA